MHCGVAAAHADGQQFGNLLSNGQEARDGLKRPAQVIRVQAGDDHALAHVRELHADFHQLLAQKLPFVNADDFGARLDSLQYLDGGAHVVRADTQSRVRNDFVHGVTLIDHRLENLHTLAGNLRAPQSPDQLLALAREHGADDHLDPAHVAFNDVHAPAS